MHLLPEKVVVQVFTMNKIPMIIMAAGVSSRMKDSSVPKEISQNLINQSNHRVKGFIQAGDGNEPIIFYIIKLIYYYIKMSIDMNMDQIIIFLHLLILIL